MQTRERKQKKKAATYSISKVTEERIDLIESEILSGGVVAENLEDIFQTINLAIFKKWQAESFEKFVTRIGSLSFSSPSKRAWMKVVENGLGETSNQFLELIELLGLKYEDIKIFAWECRNIVQRNKDQPHQHYEKKQKTYTLYEKTEKRLSKFQMILGENKSTSFQFAILLYSYLKLPYAKYHKAKRLLETYRSAFDEISRLDLVAKETAEKFEIFMNPKGSKSIPFEKTIRMQIDLDAINEEVSFYWYLLLFRIEYLELALSQIDSTDEEKCHEKKITKR